MARFLQTDLPDLKNVALPGRTQRALRQWAGRTGEQAMRNQPTGGNEKHGHQSAATEAQVAEFNAAEEQALEHFGLWLDGELETLVARWIHLAAPNASKRERALRRTL